MLRLGAWSPWGPAATVEAAPYLRELPDGHGMGVAGKARRPPGG